MNISYKKIYTPLFLVLIILSLSINYIKSLNITNIYNLNYKITNNEIIKKILSIDFNNTIESLLDYRFTKKGIFITYRKSNKIFLSFIDFYSKKENIIFKKRIQENEVGLNSWLEFRDSQEYFNKEHFKFYIFSFGNELIFVDKKTQQFVKTLYIENNGIYIFNQTTFFSKDKNYFYYIDLDSSKKIVSFKKLDLDTLESKNIYHKELNKLEPILQKEYKNFFEKDAFNCPFKIIELKNRNELVITNLDSVDIFDLKTLKYKKSIKVPKNYKLTPKNYILNKKENLIIFGKFDFEVSVLDLDKETINIFYEFKIDPEKGVDQYGEERIHFGTSQLQLSNDEKYLLEIGDDERSHLFDFKTKKILQTFWAYPFDDIRISEDSKYVVYSEVQDESNKKMQYDIKNNTIKVIKSTNTDKYDEKIYLKDNYYLKVKNIALEEPIFKNENMTIYAVDEIYLSKNKKEIPIYTLKDKINLYNQDFIYNQEKNIFGIFLYKDLNQKYITLELFSL